MPSADAALVASVRARLADRASVALAAEAAKNANPEVSAPWLSAAIIGELGGLEFAIEAFEGRETPQDVLDDVYAKRAVLDAYDEWPVRLDRIVRLLAQPFAGHPDFDPSWSMRARG